MPADRIVLIAFICEVWMISSSKKIGRASIVFAIAIISFLFVATPAFSHHALGGGLPVNFWEGFISGLAHPVIGSDHFAFVIAVGLLSATMRQGILIPIAFVLMAMAGTGIHLMALGLPAVEFLVSGSVLLFGILLVMKDRFNVTAVMSLAAIAGLFHGYAYGEAIFGAEMTPITAYLLGFSAIQLVIALSAFAVGKTMIQSPSKLRSIGFVICGIGIAFLSNQIISAIFPV
jgi:urease accessory protein